MKNNLRKRMKKTQNNRQISKKNKHKARWKNNRKK
jgi:hypothetical protein